MSNYSVPMNLHKYLKFQYILYDTADSIISRKSAETDLQNSNAPNDKRLRLRKAGFR